MAGEYTVWRKLLAGGKLGVDVMIDDTPQCGFWRTRRSKEDRTLVGVAIWKATDKFMAKRGEEIVPPDWVWPYCAKNPITEEVYRAWERTARWPDDWPITEPQREGDGSNEPDDPAVMLKDQVDSASADVNKFAEITSDDQAKQAQSLRARLNEIANEADKKRVVEKQPHLDASRAVDGKWQPIIQKAKEFGEALRKAMGAWETKKAKKAAAELAEKQRLEREAAETARNKAAQNAPAAPSPEPETQPGFALETQEEPAPLTSQIKGGYGKAASVSVVRVITEVTDWDKVYQQFAAHQDVQAVLLKVAAAAVKAGLEVDGVTTEDVREVR